MSGDRRRGALCRVVGGAAVSAAWHLRSAGINEIVRAVDQFTAWNTLRQRPTEDFGLIVTAEPDENDDRIPVHTSALMTWWGRDEEAQLARDFAISKGLPDTAESDAAFAEARRLSPPESEEGGER